MVVFIIYDNDKGGYLNWSSKSIEELAVDYALHHYESSYYPEKKKFVNELAEFLDKNRDTIHSKILSDEFIDAKIFEFSLGKLPLDWKQALRFLNKCGFSIEQVDNSTSLKIEEVFGYTRHDVVSVSDLKEG